MKPMNLKWIPQTITAVVAVVVVVLAMAWLSGSFRSHVIEPGKIVESALTKPVGAAMYVVQKDKRIATVDLVGTVQSESRTVVSSRIQAAIVEMAVDTGSAVKKGDVIVRLDDRDLKARLGQAKELLRAAEVRRDRAKRKVDRLAPLVQEHATSVDEMENWTSQLDGAVSEVSSAQQRISETEVALSDAKITSPINGIVVERLADQGDMANPGKPLVTIYDPGNLRLEASGREADIARLEELRKSKTPVPVFVDSAGREISGIVTQIVPTADPQSRSFIVKVHLSDAGGLYPGMFGRLRFSKGEIDTIEIPHNAVREVGQVAMVQVAVGDRVESRAVRLGQARGNRVEVLAGLTPGEQVLLNP